MKDHSFYYVLENKIIHSVFVKLESDVNFSDIKIGAEVHLIVDSKPDIYNILSVSRDIYNNWEIWFIYLKPIQNIYES